MLSHAVASHPTPLSNFLHHPQAGHPFSSVLTPPQSSRSGTTGWGEPAPTAAWLFLPSCFHATQRSSHHSFLLFPRIPKNSPHTQKSPTATWKRGEQSSKVPPAHACCHSSTIHLPGSRQCFSSRCPSALRGFRRRAVRDSSKGHQWSPPRRRDALARSLTNELRGFAVALSLLLLEELVAGVGAGQEEPETLQERSRGSRSAVSGIFYPTALLRDTTLIPNPAPGVAGHTGYHPGTHTVFQEATPKESASPSPAPRRTNNCKKGFLVGVSFAVCPAQEQGWLWGPVPSYQRQERR